MPRYILSGGFCMDTLQLISEGLQRGEHENVAELTRKAIDEGLPATRILNDGLLAGMEVVGRRFGAHEIANVVGLSALLTTTMMGMKNVVEIVKERGLQDKIKVIVGGAPVSQEFADEIGADAYGYDAGNAVEIVKGLMA
jgi:methanogenic corrinoid protein MtbC1